MKKKTGKRENLFSVVNYTVLVLTVIAAVYIMANGLGLIDSLDFGAGAYYYADIPQFAKYVDGSYYKSTGFHVGAHYTVPDLRDSSCINSGDGLKEKISKNKVERKACRRVCGGLFQFLNIDWEKKVALEVFCRYHKKTAIFQIAD